MPFLNVGRSKHVLGLRTIPCLCGLVVDVEYSFVQMLLTKNISSACHLCRRRNGQNEGFIQLDFYIQPKVNPGDRCLASSCGFVLYCVDCYEMLRGLAAVDFKEFRPFYELVYEEKVQFDFPPELVVSGHDPLRLWRRTIDKEAWLEKLAEERAEVDNPD